MKYLITIFIIIGIITSIILSNFIIQEYVSYKQFRKEFDEYKQASIQQITINSNDILLLAKIYNDYILKNGNYNK